MSYMIMSYGYDVKETNEAFETLEEAERKLHELVMEWLENEDLSLDDTDYEEGDHYFCELLDERGAGIYELFEVPDCKNEYDELMWDLRLTLEKIEYAAEDYKACLEECMVESYAEEAKRILDKIHEIENP